MQQGVRRRQDLARRDGTGVAARMRRVPPGSHNRGALDGDDFTPHSPLRVSPNGLELSGAHMRVRCSRGLGEGRVQTGYMVYRIDRGHG